MPTLYTIVGRVRNIIRDNGDKIKKVYITGTASAINNIDLYFQEYLEGVECEILKPYFIQATRDINIKDYIEVNSAISLGLMGVGEGITGMNFKNLTFADKMPSWLKIETKSEKTGESKLNLSGWFTWDLGQELTKIETNLIRVSIGLILLVVIYSGFSGVLAYQMKLKNDEVNKLIASTTEEINKANADNRSIQSKTSEYTIMIKELEDANTKINDRNKVRNSIPNLLNQIMSVIPERVQLTKIENTTGYSIEITAQSNKYEQLGYFTAKLKTDGILRNIVSTGGQKDNGIVSVKITGDLPIEGV